MFLILACLHRPPATLDTDACRAAGSEAVISDTAFDELWDYADPAATELAFRAASVPEAQALQLQTQIARTLGLQARFDEAVAVLDAVDAEPRGAVTTVRSLLERGRVLNSSGDPAAAAPHFRSAWTLACAQRLDFHAVDAAHMLGIVSPPEEAATWNQTALEVAAKSTDPRAARWEASLRNNIGWSQHEAGDFEAALASFEAALVLREDAGKAASIAHARWAVARTLRSLERYDEALAIQTALAEGAEDGWVFEELALCHEALGDTEAAATWAARALPLLEAEGWIGEEQPDRLEALRALLP